MKNERLRKSVLAAMLAAIAFLSVVIVRVPVVLFLSYEPKDVIITLGGFILGPVASLLISVVVSLVEMLTISSTGLIGFIMNALGSAAFACTAALIYKKKHSAWGAALGLLSGIAMMTGVMILWNYLITPIYMGYPRQAVVDLIIPAFLPFNLIKGGLNAAITMLIYKPLVTALRKAKLMPESKSPHIKKKGMSFGIAAASVIILATCILLILVMKGVI